MSDHTKDTEMTPAKLARFLMKLSEGWTVTAAARCIGYSRGHMYKLRTLDAELRRAWDEALEEGTESLEQIAIDRAVTGWEEPVFYAGEQVGTIRRFDNGLLRWMIAARKPLVYKDAVDVAAYIREMAIAEGIDPDRAIEAAEEMAQAFRRQTTGARP